MTVFTETWDGNFETKPADNENINLGALRIRNLKLDIRERMSVDHSWDGDANDGKHYHVTLRPGGVPTLDAGDGVMFSASIAGNTELFYKDSSGNVMQLTSGGAFNVVNLSVAGVLTIGGGGSLLSTGPAVFNGTATLNGVTLINNTLEVTGATKFDALATVVFNAAATFAAGVGPISGNANFYMKDTGSAPTIAFENNTYMTFNTSLNRFEFYVASALVGHFP